MDDIELWIGGDTSYSALPNAGDIVYRDGTDGDVSVAWPSDRLPMGSVHPYYVCATSRRRGGGSIGSRKFAIRFEKLPAKAGTCPNYLTMNIAMLVHERGTIVDQPFTVELTFDNSYKKNAFVIPPRQSATLSIPTSGMGEDISALFFSVTDVPDSMEVYVVANGFMMSDSAVQTAYEEFNADTWLGHYLGTADADMDTMSDRIASYVTWPKQTPIVKDNGSIEISPVGFPNVNNSGVPNIPSCTADYPEGVENPPFVSNGFGVRHGNDEGMLATTVFRQKVDIRDEKFYLPIESISASEDGSSLLVTLIGDFTATYFNSFTFVAAKGATIDGSGMENVVFARPDDVTYDKISDTSMFTVDRPSGCEVDRIGRGIVEMAIDVSVVGGDTVISLLAQDSGNGTYLMLDGKMLLMSSTPQDIIDGQTKPVTVKLSPEDMTNPETFPYADKRSYDNVWACDGVKSVPHFRKGYSDGEIYEYLDDNMSGVYKCGYGAEENSGSLVNWFTTRGSTAFTNGTGDIVSMGNFGLGSFYGGEDGTEVTAAADDGVPEWESETPHPLLRWGYGSNADATVPMTGAPALPLDWPFCTAKYGGTGNNNSITLLREKGVVDGVPVGGLDFDRSEGEEGAEEIVHYEINKHVITIYNELKPREDGTTVVKPTFVHLPAPLSTKDGDTCEIEVALQNLSYDQAFRSGTVKDLSGYRAFIAQPRVYVCGGFQEFSTKKYAVSSISEDGKTVTTVSPILDQNSEPIVHMVDDELLEVPVRVTLTNGTLTPNTVTLDGIASSTGTDQPTTITLSSEIPWSQSDRRFSIDSIAVCGIVFVRSNKEVDPTNTSGIDTGLRTRCDSLLGPDTVPGGTGLQEYNRFYSLLGSSNHTAFPAGDKRYLLATVYQGATSTFPWKLSDRKRLASIAEAMTMWADDGPDSITDRAWKANYRLLHHTPSAPGAPDDFTRITSLSGDLDLNVDDVPVTYASDSDTDEHSSAIARRLRVRMPEMLGESTTEPTANPVRQAAKAYEQLISDFAKLRMRLLDDPSTLTSEECYIDYGTAPQAEFPGKNGFFKRDTVEQNAGMGLDCVGNDSWLFKPRTLPRIVTEAFYDNELSSGMKSWEGFRANFREYIESAPYYAGTTAYSTVLEENPPVCDDIGMPGTQTVPSERSVVTVIADILKKQVRSKKRDLAIMLDDFRRLAEMQTVDYPETLRKFDEMVNFDDLSPFSHVFSLDSTPYPTVTNGTADLESEKQELLSQDVVRQYGWAGGKTSGLLTEFMTDEPDSTASGNPGALAAILKSYLPLQKSGFGRRFHSSNRVFAANGKITCAAVYSRYALEADAMCCGDGGRMNRFVCDTFINDPNRTSAKDVNPDWNKISSTLVATSLSSAPYLKSNAFYEYTKTTSTPRPELYDQAAYTRVYMCFTFSAKLGRWLTTGYRQYASAFLTPLYGNKALSEKLDGVEIWASSACDPISDSPKGLEYVPYGMISPMDIRMPCVNSLYSANPYKDTGALDRDLENDVDRAPMDSSSPKAELLEKLHKPYLPVKDGGIGLNMPCSLNGEYNEALSDASKMLQWPERSNIWSVRKYVRPATGDICLYKDGDTVKQGIDIPGLEGYTDGTVGSPGLYNMFDWPARHVTKYATPDRSDPSVDPSPVSLLWYTPKSNKYGKLKANMSRSGEPDSLIGYAKPVK